MATAVTLTVGTAKEILADVRNAGKAFFEKNVIIFNHQYVVTTDYTATDVITLNFDGAQEILWFEAKEVLATTNADLNAVESSYATGVGKTMTLAATNGSSLAVKILAIIRI